MFSMDAKCGCGDPIRYTTASGKGSCNKYHECLTYQEQADLIKKLQSKVNTYEHFLGQIVRVNAMDYEMKCWAKSALDKHNVKEK